MYPCYVANFDVQYRNCRHEKRYALDKRGCSIIAAASRAMLGASVRLALYSSSFASLMMFLGFGSIGAIAWYGGHEVIAGRQSLASQECRYARSLHCFVNEDLNRLRGSSLQSAPRIASRDQSAVGGLRRAIMLSIPSS